MPLPHEIPVRYRKVDDEWVAYGPSGKLAQGQKTVEVTLARGGTEIRTITRIEPAEVTDGIAYNNAYLTPRPPRERPAPSSGRRGRGRRTCPTGGNCSSFGSGRSCGAEDCDGW